MTELTLSPSYWVKCITQSGGIRGVAVDVTQIVSDMARRHGSSPVGARGLGEAFIGAVLIGSYCKSGQRINLNIRGDGFYKQAVMEARPDGAVRGYVVEKATSREEPGRDERVGPWGAGLMSVLRTSLEQGSQPFIGTVPLLTGHLAKDLTYYWVQSEQVPSAVGMRVSVSPEGLVQAATGFLVQAMPDADVSEVHAIEKHIKETENPFQNTSGALASPIELISSAFGMSSLMILEKKEIRFECSCTQEKVERALVLVGMEGLQEILLEQGGASVRCDFCAKEYRVSGEKLKRFIRQIATQDSQRKSKRRA